MDHRFKGVLSFGVSASVPTPRKFSEPSCRSPLLAEPDCVADGLDVDPAAETSLAAVPRWRKPDREDILFGVGP